MPTIVRLAADRFLVLTAPASQRRDADWLRRQGAAEMGVAVADVAAAWTLLRLVGPQAAALVAVGATAIGYAPVVAWAEPAFGLPGTCLLLASDFAAHAFETLREAGRPLGLACAGSYAARALRIEAGEGAWGVEIDDTVVPAELGIALVTDGGRDFIGRAALGALPVRQRLARLAILGCDDHIPLFRQEPILADGAVVGMTSSGGFGYRTGRPAALGWITDPAALPPGVRRWEVEVACERLEAEVTLLPL